MKEENFEIINLDLTGMELNYTISRGLADVHAKNILSEPMLVAWYDGKKKEEHPDVQECQRKPGWISYAEGHGGKLRININRDEYCFIYTDAC